MKQCSCCKVEKPFEEFQIDRSRRDGFLHRCKSCQAARDRRKYGITRDKQIADARRWNVQNPERYRDIQLRRSYGISLTEYNEMLGRQRGVCAVCRRADERALSVDHCHSTGQVRGLLCGACNRALGILEDDAARVEALAAYLKKQRPSQIPSLAALEADAPTDRQCPAYSMGSPGLLSCL